MGFELIKCGVGAGLVGLLLRWLVPVPTIDPSVLAHYWRLFVFLLQFFASMIISPAFLLMSVLMLVSGVAVWTITALLATYRRKVAA